MRTADLRPWGWALGTMLRGEHRPIEGAKLDLPSLDLANLLFVRPDSIGDCVLAASLIEPLSRALPRATITVLCQRRTARVFEGLPGVWAILTVDLDAYEHDPRERRRVNHWLRLKGFDVVLNSVLSRTPIGDELVHGTRARLRVGFQGDHANQNHRKESRNNAAYTNLLHRDPAPKHELARNAEFLQKLGIDSTVLRPAFVLTEADRTWAEAFYHHEELEPSRTIILFAGASRPERRFQGYDRALKSIAKEMDLSIVTLGGPEDRELHQAILGGLSMKAVDLSGRTTLGQSAAVLSLSRLALGSETGMAQVACALSVPHVILAGGGHFGRFLPYSPLTTLACLPLECFGCNWRCPFPRPYCVQDLGDAVLRAALENAFEDSPDPRIYWTHPNSLSGALEMADPPERMGWLNARWFEVPEQRWG